MKTRTLTASDRSALIRLASELPVGDAERKAILAGLSKADRKSKIIQELTNRLNGESQNKSEDPRNQRSNHLKEWPAKVIVKYRDLEDHLKRKNDREGLKMLDSFADVLDIT